MNRPIRVGGAAIAAGSLALGVVSAPGASSRTTPKPTTARKLVSLTCNVSLTAQPPADDTQVVPGASQGVQYGSINCGRRLGQGVEWTSFAIPDDGDTVGVYKAYFDSGTIRGAFDLTPEEGSLGATGTGFTSVDYTGTVRLLGGTGAFAHVKGKGTSACNSPDGVHLTCTERLKISDPAQHR